ncbi:hypothetical protein AX14_007819 [Amanita brunnescens Koide BX004]|nr:hypothetical protein AX14_007819 [Amanita brunnescens Koide BX004]
MNANVRADLLRQNGMPPLGLGTPPFIQNPPQPAQQPLAQSHMGLPPAQGQNPPMAMLATGPQNPARFLPIQQPSVPSQQQQQVRMQMQLRQPPGSAPPQLAAIGPNQLFPPSSIQQPGPNLGPRRGPQPQQHNPTSSHITGLQPGNINLAMNPQNPIQPHLRQQQPQQRMQHPMGPGMQHDMAMAIARQGAPSSSIAQNMTRTGSAMSSLNQQAFPPGMPSSHPQPSLQNSVQMSNPISSSSPRPGSRPQVHNPNMGMGTPGPSQTPANRARMTPDNAMNNPMFTMGFPGSQFPQGPSANRVANNGQYSFAPPSRSPIQLPDIPPSMPGSMINPTGGTPSRPGFQLTPAQQLEQMSTTQDSFSSPFNLQPPRPPSQHNLHPPLSQSQPSFQPPLHQQSPRQSHPPAAHPQRPSSQPQQLIPGRPPSQSGLHPPQSSLNVNNARIPVAPTNAQPAHSAMGPGPVSIAPRPPQQPMPSQGPPGAPPPLPATDPSSSNFAVPPQANLLPPVGSGQGLQRLLQFSGILANESPKKLHLSWWEECVKEYFTPSAIMKITLWKDNQRTEAKPFEIGVPILPRFFLVTTQSGVRSMTLSLDGARERPFSRSPHHCVIECPSAVWTYRYNNGYTVTLRGPMTAHVVVSQPPSSSPDVASAFQGGQRHLKFENLQFDADQHEKFISVDTVMNSRLSDSTSIRKEPTPLMNGMPSQLQQDEGTKWEEPRIMIERSLIPGEPVNAFGIPQATMRCLELAESVGQMSDLIVYSAENKLGPLEALKNYAAQLPTLKVLSPSSQPTGLR